MTETPPRIDQRLLRGWKAIAAFLEVDVRTVQRWSKRTDIPISHLAVEGRSHPVAVADELERWLKHGGAADGGRHDAPARTPEAPEDRKPAASPADPVPAQGSRRPARRVPFAMLAAALVAAVAIASAFLLPSRSVPHAASLDGETVVVRDVSGKEVWRRPLPGMRFANQWLAATVAFDDVAVIDVDGDGKAEVLANVPPERSSNDLGQLVCFDANGDERWRFAHGRAFSWRDRGFGPTYAGRLLRAVVAGDRRFVLSVAFHSHWFPVQVSLLDPATGRLEDEYWHPGAVYAATQHDLDGDGVGEVILAGLSNPGFGPGRSIVTVLEVPFGRPRPGLGEGMSDFTGARETAVALLPRPDLCTATGEVPITSEITLPLPNRLQVRTSCEGATVFHTFDFALQLVDTRVSDNYRAVHARLEQQGLLRHTFDPAELQCLARAVRLPSSPDGNDPRWAAHWHGCE